MDAKKKKLWNYETNFTIANNANCPSAHSPQYVMQNALKIATLTNYVANPFSKFVAWPMLNPA